MVHCALPLLTCIVVHSTEYFESSQQAGPEGLYCPEIPVQQDPTLAEKRYRKRIKRLKNIDSQPLVTLSSFLRGNARYHVANKFVRYSCKSLPHHTSFTILFSRLFPLPRFEAKNVLDSRWIKPCCIFTDSARNHSFLWCPKPFVGGVLDSKDYHLLTQSSAVPTFLRSSPLFQPVRPYLVRNLTRLCNMHRLWSKAGHS